SVGRVFIMDDLLTLADECTTDGEKILAAISVIPMSKIAKVIRIADNAFDTSKVASRAARGTGEVGTVGAMKARSINPLDDLVKLPGGSIVTQGGRKLTKAQVDELSKLDLSR
ncbi:hypothetical protein ACE3MQ_27235, partial [Paenibacillus lentus]|uniref:hypothetical protein n=1 Tax=Paenibacillus lentus TaxID=1338368 RepID=UPI003665176C